MSSSPETPHEPLHRDLLSFLRVLGWDAAWHAAWQEAEVAASRAPATTSSGTPGRVTRTGRDGCDVLLADPDGPVTAARATWGPALARAARVDPVAVPTAGDWVVLSSRLEGGAALLSADALLPRRTAVVRVQAGGSSHGQVLAANVDVVAVVEALGPEPDLGRIERLLALAWSSGARPVVLLTKTDLVPQAHHLVADVRAATAGVDVQPVSSVSGTGLEALHVLLRDGATVALVGASGAGKSSLLNAVTADPAGQATAPMRTAGVRTDGKGRHTTVTRELHLGPHGGAVIDTPGLRSVGLRGSESLDDVFGDVARLAADCRFDDCSHEREPGCAVLAAVDSGSLPERRLLSYRKLLREIEYQASRVDARLRAVRAGRWRAVHREVRRRDRGPGRASG